MRAKPDRWKRLRRKLFRSLEPEVELVALTKPVGKYAKRCTSESLPGFTARESYQSQGKSTVKTDKELNQRLIKRKHDTPLQAVQFVFKVTGISKTLQAQWTRHKIGVGWTFRSTRYVPASNNCFIYPTYDYIDDRKIVEQLLAIEEEIAKTAISNFDRKRELGASKEDSRRVMPVAFATSCYFYTNARALRYFFRMRLDKAAEWETRRMASIMFDLVMKWTPSLFADLLTLREKGKEEAKQ